MSKRESNGATVPMTEATASVNTEDLVSSDVPGADVRPGSSFPTCTAPGCTEVDHSGKGLCWGHLQAQTELDTAKQVFGLGGDD